MLPPAPVLTNGNCGVQRMYCLLVTAACGVGHVTGSILLGFVGISIGAALHRLQWIEGLRGDLAAWALTAFGLVPQSDLGLPSSTVAIEEIALPKVSDAVAASSFWRR